MTNDLRLALRMVEHYDVLIINNVEEGLAQHLYKERNTYVLRALAAAIWAHLPAGIRIDPKEPEWPVVYIELPSGQVSWHLPQHVKEYDGHSTEEKLERVRRFLKS